MAATATPAEDQVSKVTLRILVDKEKNRVLFAEAGKDFVDVLLSFLTLPLGTIARLVGRESNMQPVRVGSLSSLYQSVPNLEEEHLWTETCKSMLLQPRNSMESFCRNLKLNIDDTDPIKHFICENWEKCCREEFSGLLSTFKNLRCSCGKLMNREIPGKTREHLTLCNGFVHETATFIVSDDLNVMPNVPEASVVLLQNLGIEDMDAIGEQTVNVSKKEIVDLLKCSLLSKTPLTDLFLTKKQILDNFNPINHSKLEIAEVTTDEGRQMVVKLMLRKSDSRILFAQADEDFADFLFSFLTFPLGGVLHMLEGCSSLSCVDKLYKSMAVLSDRYLRSPRLKDILANPQIASQFNLSNQILPIGAEFSSIYHFTSWYSILDIAVCGTLTGSVPDDDFNDEYKSVPLSLVDPKSPTVETSKSPRGFIKGPSVFMVTDDLVVTPMSSISAVSFLNRSKVPLCDLEEKVISIGVKEGLGILKASLISTSALTNGLNQFLKAVKEEK